MRVVEAGGDGMYLETSRLILRKPQIADVDDYLEFCKDVGKEPDKEYKGTFNIRISPDLHKRLAIVAMQNGDTLNATVEKAIVNYVTA